MSEKKSARPDVGASERAKEPGQASRQGRASTSHDTTTGPQWQGFRVADFLCTGQAHAVPLRDLVTLTGWSGRAVRLAIRKERLSGVPICEDSRTGYYLAKNTDERDLCARRLRHRAAQIAKVADAIEGAGI